MLRIAIIEDDKEYRDAFKAFFSEHSEYFSCDFAVESIEKFIKYSNPNLELEIVLVDIQLQGMSGIKGVSQIRKLKEDAEIIMLTTFDDPKMIFQAISSGADGYLLKNLSFEEIEKELLKTIKNGAAISPQIAKRIIKYFQPTRPSFLPKLQPQLSDKEKQIIQLVIDGKTYEEVAPILGLSINGLKYHVKNIYKKLRVKSKTGLIKKMLKGD